ncbi:hypothetical protein [Bacteroides acidifaciens]|uniref:hypothetical protein n=1 Tax=Bacteroides acidifaciens TaxID=85831 RepID=UPI0027151690|nr:hypothetical protein [Bacteroides acidifaciens]
MARTVKEIKDAMTATFCQERAVVSAYGLNPKKTFDQQFSSVSIENILFYCFAFAVWTLEVLFDKHREEVETKIEQLEPHTLRWYVRKAKAFMYGRQLVPDADYYDTAAMSETDIDAARVVKYAVASESNTVVYLKVAARDDKGQPTKLNPSQFASLTSYMNTVKDAGVAIKLVNEDADKIQISMVVYYDPTAMDSIGTTNDGTEPVVEAVKAVITNLPFNGVFRKSDLLAAVTAVPGVEVADVESVRVKTANAAAFMDVVGYDKPYSGYYAIDSLNITYNSYDALNNPTAE